MTHRTVSDGTDTPPGLPDDVFARVTSPHPACPVEITLAALRGRWTTLLVRELLPHEHRTYTELAAALPHLSPKVLADRLTQLLDAGVLERTRTPGWPATVTYALTPRGRELGPVIQALWDWGAAGEGRA
ncbi:transcriptional regulator [Streptomyces alfalfae]|uniref:MarR family transcriptional regulator n=1 Tax=Streptomyces alfalfae TaxID=1642299 RepID=A0ABN4VJN7_9ACTN|nr:helix-turn-helix domain-containing protein [Streptomyces alfalfae]APY86678.1 MarR family transcriptional regulator [Streptomyces alfalfae]AYA17065.1 transcriptional regulator [Streptomyces fradiae]RXX37790.1 transcriptional regulator [Streptomyces alfalfae]RZN06040.1 transcriptional regulator [Streptomyces alfalfae]